MEGKIESIDSLKIDNKTYYRVIDYKSGNKILRYFDIWHGLNIQLPLYMEALLNNLSENDMPAGLLYFKIDEPVIKASPDDPKEEIESRLAREMRMTGLVLGDPDVILGMDAEAQGGSNHIPAKLNKDGAPSRSSAATYEDLRLLGKHARKIVADNGKEILDGNTSIHP